MLELVARRLLARSSSRANFSPAVRRDHGEPYDDKSLTGFKRMFNGETIRGRANYAKLYLALWAGGFIIYKLSKGKKTTSDPQSVKAKSE